MLSVREMQVQFYGKFVTTLVMREYVGLDAQLYRPCDGVPETPPPPGEPESLCAVLDPMRPASDSL